jgi:hypothetical protein
LPCKFSVTDSLADEFLNPPFRVLAGLGLRFESLNSEENRAISALMERYPKPSYYDLSVLVLARSKHTILITGDDALRNAAADNGVDCHANEGLITYTEAIVAYQVIVKKPRYPPKNECKALLAHWRQRQKLLE